MTHCIVSLKHVSRFESETEVEFDPICIDKNASKYSATISNQENVQGLLNKSIFTTKVLNIFKKLTPKASYTFEIDLF